MCNQVSNVGFSVHSPSGGKCPSSKSRKSLFSNLVSNELNYGDGAFVHLKRIYDEFPRSECDPKEMFKRHVSSHDSDKIFNEIAGTIKFNHVSFLNFIKDWANSPQNIDTAKTISIETIKSKIGFADTDQEIRDSWMSFIHDVKDHSVFQRSNISRNKNTYITIVNYFKENIQNPELFKKSDLTLYAFMK
jgi:hypothetical protein